MNQPVPRNPKAKRTSISCTLPEALAAQLQLEADTRMLAPSLLIERAVAAYLPNLPSIAEPERTL